MHHFLGCGPSCGRDLTPPGVLDEVLNVMDSHKTHGGVQNVALVLLRTILKDCFFFRSTLHFFFLLVAAGLLQGWTMVGPLIA